ncbi:hypothetical protein BWQ96_05045 [Gracilariopsis chorda]|uniref:Uncharacterized protein n=1 Tax=Gracilariopsis chorda TaxID=448386 RepID=A0A2V3ISW2_9FLOR|nr:hypothetical protein BWQ96_05045 [Gracilariopsis chorda]|eukprot:PXF45215.1 hypothetical protein BWQ96_05045 [Gracilariopsis chorda]
MIRDEYLTYAGAQSAFRNWRPESDIFFELVFAVLVTVFVYQLTKLLLEVSLGQKRKGEIVISDLYVYMVVSGLSFSAVVSNIRSLFRGKQDDSQEERSPSYGLLSSKSARTARVLAKFVLLVLSIPGIHILGIFLSIETETDLSFKDVNFGGLAMGLREDRSNIKMNRASSCPKVLTRFGHGETGTSDFFRCYTMTPPIPFDNEDNLQAGRFIAILRSSSNNIGVTIVTPGKRWISFLTLNVNDGKQTYLLKNTLSSDQRSRIFESGVRELVAPCNSSLQTRGIDISWVIPPSLENEPKQDILRVLVECPGYDETHLAQVGNDMLNNVSFVQTERFEVSESFVSEEFVPADDLIFFRRRGSNASLLAMLIITVIVILARVLVGFVLSIEGPFALEVIIKDRFGLKCCDSMLQYEQKVNYGKHSVDTIPKIYAPSDDVETCSSSQTEPEC